MMSINPPLPPVPAPADLAALGALVKFISEMIANPKESRKLVDAYLAAATEYQQAHERVLQGQRDLNERTADFERMSVRRQRELDFTIERDRKAFDTDVAARRAALEADQKELTRLKELAAKDAAVVAAARQEWENKMAALAKLASAA
jgi:hypothetical protein